MTALGMKYNGRKKNYYVDGHERPDVVRYRKHYILSYFKDEMFMYRWIQISYEEYVALLPSKEAHSNFFTSKIGYRYIDASTKEKMLEIHVDTFHSILDKYKKGQENKYIEEHIKTEFGGNLSVRKPIGRAWILGETVGYIPHDLIISPRLNNLTRIYRRI